MNKTIGLLAHVDAGKTTFAEQLLYHTNSIRSRGRVDHQDAFLDSHAMEKARGITIFAGQAVMTYKNSTYYLMDTPGHVDFSAEMERAIQVMDYAVVIVSAVEGVEGHTETVWQLLEKYNIPTVLFINKIDRSGADVSAVLSEIHAQLTPHALHVNGSLLHGEMTEDVILFTAERDEELFEAYVEGKARSSQVTESMAQLIQERALFMVMSGSALLDQGMTEFMENVEHLTRTVYDDNQAFAAKVFKIRHDPQGSRVTFMKLTQGQMSVRDELTYTNGNGEEMTEKITSIRVYNGDKYTMADYAKAGQLIAVTGLTQARAGDGLGYLDTRAEYQLIAALKSKVIYPATYSVREVLHCFQVLDAEDPSLHVTWDEGLQELHVHVMGAIQLEVLEQVVRERFGMMVSFGTPEILYYETITKESRGYGHFEPLGHYAEVHLKLEPGVPNSGVVAMNACHADDLSNGYQHLILQHVTEAEHHGLLTGSPLTDVIVTLMTGRAHNKHTSGGDFREATRRALRQGLEQAEMVLLEPYYTFKIKVDLVHIGRVMSDIQQAHGSFDAPEMYEDKAILTGIAPVATFMQYGLELASFTKGKGALTLQLAGYQPCHQAEAVISERKYDKNADLVYTSSSIFCSKGQAYSVPWTEAERHMHIRDK
ncbi:GTP-binding protein [Paenibacillus selenitireducens]